jgi:hypothetical protein
MDSHYKTEDFLANLRNIETVIDLLSHVEDEIESFPPEKTLAYLKKISYLVGAKKFGKEDRRYLIESEKYRKLIENATKNLEFFNFHRKLSFVVNV